MLLHITTREAWDLATAAGEYRASTLETEGFMHMSEPNQVVASAERHCRGLPDLVLLCIDPQRLIAELRYELAPARGELFPHLFGPLNLEAVIAVLDLPETTDGFTLPPLPSF